MITATASPSANSSCINRVLIVEDDDYSAMAIMDVLEDANYEVTVAANGTEALECLAEQDCPIVVSDWNMPSMNGLDLCRAIREQDARDYTYFIMLTCRDDPQDIVDGLAAGADDFVTKPWSSKELRHRVDAGNRIVSRESYELTVVALMKVVELRSTETGAHLQRVQYYTAALAAEMSRMPQFAGELDERTISLIRQASPLHDIGKVAISDLILNKPCSLNPSEREHMHDHTTIGAETLEDALISFPRAMPFMQMACDIAQFHHEKFDGTGYPLGLAGREIPLCGRIVAVCDVYDALTSRRVYKKAYSHEIARNYITAESGRSFDPAIVRAFLNVHHCFQNIRKRLPD